MTIPFLPKIPIGSARSVGRGLIPKLYKFGFSANGALKWLKYKGFGYRRKTFLLDWRQILGIKKKKDPIRNVRPDTKPGVDLMVDTEDEQHNKYKYTYKATIKDQTTGEISEKFISIGSDKIRQYGVMDEMADIILHGKAYGDKFEVLSIEREGITRRMKD